MGTSVRKLDQIIREAERRLAAVERREMWPLTGSERRTVLANLTTGAVKAGRGRSTSKAGRAIEGAWDAAAARLRAEISAATQEKSRAVQDAAGARVARKAKGWW